MKKPARQSADANGARRKPRQDADEVRVPRRGPNRESPELTLRRRWWLVVLVAAFLSALFSVGSVLLGEPNHDLAEPVQLDVRGLYSDAASQVWYERMEFSLPQSQFDKIEGVDVAIGDRKFSFTKEQFHRQWAKSVQPNPGGGEPTCTAVAPADVSAPRSRIPWFQDKINWPGDGPYLCGAAPARLLILLWLVVGAVALLRMPYFRSAERRFLDGLAAGESATHGGCPPAAGSWRWLAFGAVVFVAAILIVEINQPYYFTQDDVFSAGLPATLFGCRNVFCGEFPEWNPYQLMGSPMASLGGACLLYPPTYLAYGAARFVFGNEYLTIETWSILHLAAGYLATYWAARRVGLRPSLAAVGSLCVVLSGFSLIVGRGWHIMLPTAVWTPLLVVALVEFAEKEIGWKWAAATGTVIALFYYVGFSQFWFYSMLCFLAAAAWMVMTGGVRAGKLLWVAAAVVFGIGLSGPLLCTQLLWTSLIERPPAYGSGMEVGLLATLLPYPFTHAPFPDAWGNAYREFRTQMYYSGSLFCLATFLGFGGLLAYRSNRRMLGENVWLFCAGLAMLLALGKPGLLATLFAKLPVLDKTSNNPFRALACFNLFAVLGGGMVVERMLRHVGNRRAWELGLAATVALLLLYHASIARTSFYLFGDRPYPEMPAEMAALLKPADPAKSHRCIVVTPSICSDAGYPLAMMDNFPTLYSVFSYDGYDPLVQSKPQVLDADDQMVLDPVGAAKAYGIQWLVIHRSLEKPLSEVLPQEKLIVHEQLLPSLHQASRSVLKLPEVEIRELPGACPLAFAETAPDQGLPIQLRGAGVDVDVSSLAEGGAVIVNFLNWPCMEARAGGRPLPLEPDEWGRMRTQAPAGATCLEIRYSPPWGLGCRLGGCLALVGALLGMAAFYVCRPAA